MDFARLLALLERRAPRTAASLSPAAAEDQLHTAQRRTGGWNWPDDVLQFYAECDGTARTPEGCILPGLRPLSLAEIAEWWQILLISHYLDDNEIGRHDELFCAQLAANPPADVLELQKQPAGEPLGRFIGPLLPLAEDQSGSFLVADRRRGRRRGCVSLLDKVDGTLGAHSWDSVGRLVDAAYESLVTGTPVDGTRIAGRVLGGKVVWGQA